MSALPASVADRLGKLLPRLASAHEGEVTATAGAIQRTLKAAGLDLHDLAKGFEARASIERPAQPKRYVYTPRQTRTHRQLAVWTRDHDRGRLSPRERDFVAGVLASRRELTILQADWLGDLTDRLFWMERGQ